MWELDYQERWAPKNWCFWTVVLEKTWESLGLHGDPTSLSKRKSVLNIHWKDWCWSWNYNNLATWCKELTLIWKDPNARKDWGQEKGVTEDKMDRWHHWLSGHEFEQTCGDSKGQGSVMCCSSWGHKELDTTQQLNNNSNFISVGINLQIDKSDSLPSQPPWKPQIEE